MGGGIGVVTSEHGESTIFDKPVLVYLLRMIALKYKGPLGARHSTEASPPPPLLSAAPENQ